MTTTTLRLPPRIARLPHLRQIVRGGLAARGSIGAGLAAKAGGAAAVPWYLAGGAPAPYAVWQPINAASLAASYLRIAGAGGNANLDPAVVGSGVAPSFNTATGWGLTAASSQWLETGIAPVGGWSILIRVSSGPTSGNFCPLGVAISASVFFYSGAVFGNRYYASGSQYSPGAAVASAVFATAGQQGYKDGVADGSVISGSGWTNAANRTLTIGKLGNNLSTYYYTGNILAVAIWDTSTNHATWMPQVMAACALI